MMTLRTIVLVLAVTALPLAAAAQTDFRWDIPYQGSVNDLLQLEQFHTFVKNTGSATDTIQVTMVKEMPGSWSATLCEGTLCYPPFILDITFVLAPGDSTNLDIDLTPVTDQGAGTATITVTSKNDPGVTETRDFTVVSTGLDLLYVDAGGSPSFAPYFNAALDLSGKSYARWDREVMGKLTTADISSFASVVWGAGAAGPALDIVDRNTLTSYLFGGGTLYLGGADLLERYCDPGSPDYDADTKSFFNFILGVDYGSADSGSFTATGVAADPLGDGLTLSLQGGDGAGTNTDCDVLLPLGSGVTAIQYGSGQAALTRVPVGPGLAAIAGFGFEGLASATDRDDLMDAVLGWLGSQASPVPDDLPTVFATSPLAVPNPFNPRTNIQFEIGGTDPVSARIQVHDLKGRLVRRLYQGQIAPGPYATAWDGKDSSGRTMPAGQYFALIRLDDQIRSVKMTLTK